MQKFLAQILLFTTLFTGYGLIATNQVKASGALAPTASLISNPMRGSITTEFHFDASGSRDSLGKSTGMQFRFSPDYPAGPFLDWQTSPRLRYTYENEGLGEKRVIVEVKDEFGYTSRATLTVHILADHQALGGYFEVSPLSGDLDTDFQFVSHVRTPEGPEAENYKIRWDFDGDGIWDTQFNSEKVIRHYFPEAGFFRPKAEIQSPEREVASLDHLEFEETEVDPLGVLVSDPNQPIARLSVNSSQGIAGKTSFTFDASESTGINEGSFLDYRFDFGKGLYSQYGRKSKVNYVFETPGKYTVTVEVRDKDGKTDLARVNVEVEDENHAPTIAFRVFQPTGVKSGTSGTTGSEYRFTSSVTDLDEGSSKLKVRWDFDGDGVWDTPFAQSKSAVYVYRDPGTKTVHAEVVDSTNRTGRTSDQFLVVQNTAPKVLIDVEPKQGTRGTTFEVFIASLDDHQTETGQLEARYDLNGDGVYDTDFRRVRKIRHNFDSSGEKKIKVQVRDPQGLLSEDTVSVKVVDSSAPHARIDLQPGEVGVFTTTFAVSAENSFDRETVQKNLKQRWDFDYQGPNDIVYDTNLGNTPRRNIKFNTIGEHQIRLEIMDEDGMTSSAVTTIRIHWAAEYIEKLRKSGVMKGYERGDMRPDQQVTRAEFLKMLLTNEKVSFSGQKYRSAFKDVSKRDWHWKYVEKAHELGYIGGFTDGTFRPNEPISRAEVAALIAKAYNLRYSNLKESVFTDVKTGDWFYWPVHQGYEEGLFKGFEDGTFRPNQKLTRGEAAKLIVMLEGLSLK